MNHPMMRATMVEAKVGVSTRVIIMTVLNKQGSLKVSAEAVVAVALGSPKVVAEESKHVECIY